MNSRKGSGEIFGIILIVVVVIALLAGFKSCTIVHPGEVGVQVTMGSVSDVPLEAGWHMISPFSHIVEFDVRQQTIKEENVAVSSRDQLVSNLDVSIQYMLNPKMTPKILNEIGNLERIVTIVIEPNVRSALREATRSIDRAEEYSNNETQVKLQNFIMSELKKFEPMGIHVNAVLLRDIRLPKVIMDAVQSKKEREQAAIRQEAILQGFVIEQKQKVAQAEAEKNAAEQEALKIRIQADAEAYKIGVLNKAAASSPVYVQLKALETLNEMSKNPAHKMFFIDSKGQYPVPLLHMGEYGDKTTKALEAIKK